MRHLPEKLTARKPDNPGEATSMIRKFMHLIASMSRRWNRLKVFPPTSGRVIVDDMDNVTIFINPPGNQEAATPFQGFWDPEEEEVTIGGQREDEFYRFNDTIFFDDPNESAVQRQLEKTTPETVNAVDGEFVYYEITVPLGVTASTATATLRSATSVPNPLSTATIHGTPYVVVLGRIKDNGWVQYQYGDVYIQQPQRPISVVYDSTALQWTVRFDERVLSESDISTAMLSQATKTLKFNNIGSSYLVTIFIMRAVLVVGGGVRWQSAGVGIAGDAVTTTAQYPVNSNEISEVVATINFSSTGIATINCPMFRTNHYVAAMEYNDVRLQYSSATAGLSTVGRFANVSGGLIIPVSSSALDVYLAANWDGAWELTTTPGSFNISYLAATVSTDAAGLLTSLIIHRLVLWPKPKPDGTTQVITRDGGQFTFDAGVLTAFSEITLPLPTNGITQLITIGSNNFQFTRGILTSYT